MEESKFFRFIWRFNGIVFMCAGVLAIGVLAFAGYRILRDVTREKGAISLSNVAEDTRVNEKWQLGQLEKIGNMPYLMVTLYSAEKYSRSYYSESAKPARNILFINSRTNQKRWFFDTNDYLIVTHELLPEREYDQKDKPVKAILFLIVKKDTNGDNRLTTDDKADVIISMPDGSNAKEILRGIDILVGQRTLDNDTLLIIFQKEGVGYSASVLLSDFSLSNQTVLPELKKNS